MPNYANLSGKSGVRAYQLGPGYILVSFKDGSTYRYDYPTTGKSQVDEMQNRARAGYGLNRYINKVVRFRYASKGAVLPAPVTAPALLPMKATDENVYR